MLRENLQIERGNRKSSTISCGDIHHLTFVSYITIDSFTLSICSYLNVFSYILIPSRRKFQLGPNDSS